jgi:ligand-binding sensor protein
MAGNVIELFENCSPKSSNFLKKVQQGYPDFQKLSGNVIDLSGKSPVTLSNFCKNDRRGW